MLAADGLHCGFPDNFKMDLAVDRTKAVEFRASIRSKQHTGPTSGSASDFVQANFVAMPKSEALDFLIFCLKNSKPCPLLAVMEPGEFQPSAVAAGADVRTDIPKYRVYEFGKLSGEHTDISALWREDMVAFLLGCSFSWEGELAEAGLCPRHVEENRNVPMYKTNIPNTPAGRFKGVLVVSMRPYLPHQVAEVSRITSRYPGAHGGPIHVGNPEQIGIDSSKISKPDFGDAVTIREGEICMFWACGVTPQSAIMDAKIPLAITHAPGHMFVTDILTSEMTSMVHDLPQ